MWFTRGNSVQWWGTGLRVCLVVCSGGDMTVIPSNWRLLVTPPAPVRSEVAPSPGSLTDAVDAARAAIVGAAFDVGLLDGLSRRPDTRATADSLCSGPGGVPASVGFVLAAVDDVVGVLGLCSESEAPRRSLRLRMASDFLRSRPGPVALLSLDRLLGELEASASVAA